MVLPLHSRWICPWSPRTIALGTLPRERSDSRLRLVSTRRKESPLGF
jgi:hypothetical protein